MSGSSGAKRVICESCAWVGKEGDLLRAPNPFDPSESLYGCPECFNVECFRYMCDEPGCDFAASCGWLSADGYRNTCGQHWHKEELQA